MLQYPIVKSNFTIWEMLNMANTIVKQHVPIFISSTYEDLIPYREEVQRTLIRLEQIVKGMNSVEGVEARSFPIESVDMLGIARFLYVFLACGMAV